MNELQVAGHNQPLAVADLRVNIIAIQDAMATVMKDRVHYGTIPGCGKPSLWKPGAEVIASMFGIAVEVDAEDLGINGEIRYRVKVRGVSKSGVTLGEGIGECSSEEEKYRWRGAVCKEEFDATPENRRRMKWKKGNPPYAIQQVRCEPADIANTVLKMSKKRAFIDMVLTCTAASDCFTQDLEDMPREVLDRAPAPQQAMRRPEARAPASNGATNGNGNMISDPQRKRFFAKCRTSDIPDATVKLYLKENWGVDTSSDIKREDYDECCTWADEFAATAA